MTAVLAPPPEVEWKSLFHNAFGAAMGLTTSAVGVVGVWLGLLGLFGPARAVSIGWLLPLSGAELQLDPLGGFFMALTGAVAVPVGVYTIGYAHHLSRTAATMLPVFVAAMLLVPAAASVMTFLFAWELMAIASLVLVVAEHSRPEVRSAALVYAAMTQLGFVAILVGLMVLSAAGGADRFADLTDLADGARTAVFLLTFAGFGSKAGLVPLHAWLPRAHPEAPSPVSALMSAAMVNLGVYGIVRFDMQLLGAGPRWWALLLMGVGAVSALYGVLQASVATDLKRLLAYSTTENMGLITLALGAAMLFADSGRRRPPRRSRWPRRRCIWSGMRRSSASASWPRGRCWRRRGCAISTGSAGWPAECRRPRCCSAWPPWARPGCRSGPGFVSEWLLLQSLIHAAPGHDTVVALTAPLAVGAVALTTGLGVAAMVKAFGIGFLARPRSEPAAAATRGPGGRWSRG